MKCFYHSADLDGKCSAAIVHLAHPHAELCPINYGQPFPWERIAPGETVYMVDFSLQPFSDMQRLQEHAMLVWIDHHKSAIEDAAAAGWREADTQEGSVTVYGIRRSGIGACALTWEYLYPSTVLPFAVRMLAEYDVWNHAHPTCLPFQYGMRLRDNGPMAQLWYTLLWLRDADKVDRISHAGSVVRKYQSRQDEICARTCAFETTLDGLRVIAINRGPTNSQLFDSVYDPARHHAMLAFYVTRDGRWSVSLYSDRDDVDCSAVAKARGGGGHKGAAGFQCDDLPFQVKGS